jgi:hypothetical protein
MKAYKLEILVIDFDEVAKNNDKKAIGEYIENARYPNCCIYPHVISIQEAEIGDWIDSHPLNQGGLNKEKADKYFK